MAIYYVTINSGSSSIKFAVFNADGEQRVLDGTIAGIGFEVTTLTIRDEPGSETTEQLQAADHVTAAQVLVDWLSRRFSREQIAAIGHRVVHGGPTFSESTVITDEVLVQLQALVPFAPIHLPTEIRLIEAMRRHFPDVPHVACFDTAFHSTMPGYARLLPIPRKYEAKGVRRYGFHGLSYAYLLEKLRQTAGDQAAEGRVIMAHLGNGASLVALKGGRSVDTSMGLTPTSGVPMSARSGDLDAGLIAHLAQTEGMTIEQFSRMVDSESGLLGVSETSSDMEKLLAIESTDSRAAEAIALFCYSVKKYIGAYAAALGGVDTLIFSGGMGEAAPRIRARICEDLAFLGITIDTERNERSAEVISADSSAVTVRVMSTDEAAAMVKDMARIVKGQG